MLENQENVTHCCQISRKDCANMSKGLLFTLARDLITRLVGDFSYSTLRPAIHI